MLGLGNKDENAFVVMKYFDSNHQCFSEWDNSQLKDFTGFIDKINNMNWTQIYGTSGKGKNGKKGGFGYRVHKNKKVLPNQSIINRLSEDITFFELRVSKEARVHNIYPA